MQNRAIILLMDSLGAGASLDAVNYGDEGSNTLGHIIEACLQGKADLANVRTGPLNIPHLSSLGICWALLSSTGVKYDNKTYYPEPTGMWGYAVEQSLGKDTPSGHWEIAGVPVLFEWGYFKDKHKCFPKKFIDSLIKEAKLPGVLGEKHASGTVIINELGAEHQATGAPIVYTSADSVFQIAAHEESFGLERLYKTCEIARRLIDPYNIGRVIARPFLGKKDAYYRTSNRHDYAVLPPAPTLLDKLKENSREVIAIGKVDDIFAHQGTTRVIKADSNMHLFDATLDAMKHAPAGSLIFTNFVDFDSSYGHRRDVAGYAYALEQFDKKLVDLKKILQPNDMVIITADHGCDPVAHGTDHTREHVPILAFGPHIMPKFIGRRETFADIGQTIANYLKINPLANGVSFL